MLLLLLLDVSTLEGQVGAGGSAAAGNTSEPVCSSSDVEVGSVGKASFVVAGKSAGKASFVGAGVAGSRNRGVATGVANAGSRNLGVADAGDGRKTTTGRRMPHAGDAFEADACFRCRGQSFV